MVNRHSYPLYSHSQSRSHKENVWFVNSCQTVFVLSPTMSNLIKIITNYKFKNSINNFNANLHISSIVTTLGNARSSDHIRIPFASYLQSRTIQRGITNSSKQFIKHLPSGKRCEVNKFKKRVLGPNLTSFQEWSAGVFKVVSQRVNQGVRPSSNNYSTFHLNLS